MYFSIASSVTFPLLQQKYPLAHRCRPQELLFDVLKLRHQVVRRLPLQPLQQPTDRDLRRDRYQQMHMVFRHMPLHDLYFMLGADVADQVPCSCCHLPNQRRPLVFRHPDQMQMNLKNGVRSVPVVRHAPSLSRGALAEAVA